MKKALYTLALLIVVLLPSLGQAQDPTDNGTLPEYNVWLPVVGGYGGDPYCQVIVGFETPADGAVIAGNTIGFFGYYVPLGESEYGGPAGHLFISLTPYPMEGNDILHNSSSLTVTHMTVERYFSETIMGFLPGVYYYSSRVACLNGRGHVLGPYSPVRSFTIVEP